MSGPISYAQTLGVVKGRVRDAQTRKPLASATASLTERIDQSSEGRTLTGGKPKVIGAMCDGDGDFDIEGAVVGRAYILKVAHIGYKADSGRVVQMDGSTEELDLGEIMLRPDSITTGDVVVTEKRPDVVVMADKTVYAVEQSGAYSANNVNELLGQLPAVFVDQDGNISLRGGTGFTINSASTADINKSLSWRVSYEYYMPPTIGASQNGAYMSLRTSLRQKLFEEKLSISLNVNDPFNAQSWQRSFDSPEFRTESTGRWQTRYVGLDVAYSFGTTPEMQEHDLPQGSGPRE